MIFFISKTPQLKQLWVQWILTTMTKLYPRQSSYWEPSLQGTHPSRAPILPGSPSLQNVPSSRGVFYAFDALGQSSYFPCAQPLRLRPATSVSSALRTLRALVLVSHLSRFVIECSFHPSMDIVLFPCFFLYLCFYFAVRTKATMNIYANIFAGSLVLLLFSKHLRANHMLINCHK